MILVQQRWCHNVSNLQIHDVLDPLLKGAKSTHKNRRTLIIYAHTDIHFTEVWALHAIWCYQWQLKVQTYVHCPLHITLHLTALKYYNMLSNQVLAIVFWLRNNKYYFRNLQEIRVQMHNQISSILLIMP